MEPHVALAVRLRELRKRRGLTQAQLAKALDVSVAAISSWESENNTLVPTDNRITALSTLYASSRSRGTDAVLLPPDEDLTAQERGLRDDLVRELMELRTPTVDSSRIPLAGPGDAIGGGTWYFADKRPVRVICGLLPEHLRANMPYTTTAEPDYTSLYNLADLDALLELYGHLRATNPAIGDLQIRTGVDLTQDDLTCHLVILGGVDLWSETVLALVEELNLPVHQVRLDDEAYFEVTRPEVGQHQAELTGPVAGERRLRSDVAHFYRGPNPYNRRRTVTICNGLYARGTYGAVRALTDARFRDRNEGYLAERFADSEQISLLMRVTVPVAGKTLTPDWTVPETRLHEWP
jgi:transcriptional regulator with XRE-family HTH domain